MTHQNFKILKTFLILICIFAFWILIFDFSTVYALNLDKLKTYFLEGDYKSAILEGENIIAGATNSSGLDELYYLQGLSYLKEGNFLRASDIFEIILNEFRGSRFREEAILGLGDSYFLREDLTKAEEYYQKLISDNPRTRLKAQAYYRLSQSGFKKGDTAQGKEYLDKLRQEFPDNPELRSNQDLSLLLDSPADFCYAVQVGSFVNPANARNLCDKLIEDGYLAYIQEIFIGSKKIYRVKVGKLKSHPEAVQLQDKLSSEGYPTKICP